VACSTELPRKGFMVYNQKTAPELSTVDGNDPEAIRRASRAYRRTGGV